MKIGIDFDDVLFDCNTSLARFHNTNYGTRYERKDVRTWHLEQIWNCTPMEATERLEKYYASPEHAETAPMPGAVEAIARLAQTHELHIVTARPHHFEMETRAWLNRHFPETFSGLHFTDYFKVGVDNKTKADVCEILGITIFVEDIPLHALNIAAIGIPVLLFDSPWNQEEPARENITRVIDWKKTIDFIETFSPAEMVGKT